MRLNPALLNTVMFVCQEQDDSPGDLIPVATAFLVRIVTEGEVPQTWKYLITARHNIDLAKDPVSVRYNLTSGEFDHFETQKTDWISSDHADVSCLPFWTPSRPRTDIDHASILVDLFVNRDGLYSGPPLTAASSPFPVALGDELAFVGLFSGHPGQNRNTPIVRFGNLSALPGDTIRLTLRNRNSHYSFDVVGYLAECRSWGGVSGSPVLWTATTQARIIEAPAMKGAKQAIPLNGLLGLVSGHFDIEQKAETSGDVLGEIRTGINSGIAVVTPAAEIEDLLDREDVAYGRRLES